MKLILLFVLLSTGQWFSFLPSSPEMNSMQACEEVRNKLSVTNPDAPIVASFCKSFTKEEYNKLYKHEQKM